MHSVYQNYNYSFGQTTEPVDSSFVYKYIMRSKYLYQTR